MPRTSNRAEDAAKGSFVVYMGLTVMLIMIFLIGRNTYSTFLQTKMDEQVFSVKANCSINRIISRFQQDNKSASIFVNSSFVVSVQWSTENGTVRQEFEEYMVPTPLQPNPVSVQNRVRISCRISLRLPRSIASIFALSIRPIVAGDHCNTSQMLHRNERTSSWR